MGKGPPYLIVDSVNAVFSAVSNPGKRVWGLNNLLNFHLTFAEYYDISIQNTEYRIQNTEYRIQNAERRTSMVWIL